MVSGSAVNAIVKFSMMGCLDGRLRAIMGGSRCTKSVGPAEKILKN